MLPALCRTIEHLYQQKPVLTQFEMQIKNYTDAQSFVNHLQEAQRQGQRVRLGQVSGTLEVFEAPSRTFGRDSKAQYEVDQALLSEQQALGDRLNELVSKQAILSPENFNPKNPAHVQAELSSHLRLSTEETHQALLRGLRLVLTQLQSMQELNPTNSPQALPVRLMHLQHLLEGPQVGHTEEVVQRALSLLNTELSSLRFMVPAANDPQHPVGEFCNFVRQTHLQSLQTDTRTGLRPGLDALASTDHAKDPQAFRRFFSRAAHAIASLLDQPQLKHLAQKLRQLLQPMSNDGLRSSQLRDVALQTSAMKNEVMDALKEHPLKAAVQRVFNNLENVDFLAMENLLTTELLDAANALADHGQVDLAHEMLMMGRKLSSQSDPLLKDLADTVAVLRLMMPQLQALASEASAFSPETSASQANDQLSASRCEADRQCVKDFVGHFRDLVEHAPMGTSQALAVQTALVRHPDWHVSQALTLTSAESTSASAAGTKTTTLAITPNEASSAADFQAKARETQVSSSETVTPTLSVATKVDAIAQPDRDLINADLLINELAQSKTVQGTPWRQEAQNLQAQLQEGLSASEQQLKSGTAEVQEELSYQQRLHQHLTRLERLIQTPDSLRPSHVLVAKHANRPDLSLADQLAQTAPDITPAQFMAWLDGQLVSARTRLASVQPPSSLTATSPDAARLLGVRQALEIEVQQLQRTRDDSVTLWGNNATSAVATIPLIHLQRTVQQALIGTADSRPDTLLEPAALRPVQDILRQQVDAQLHQRLLFEQAPVSGLSDTDFAVAIGLQAELDYLGSSTDEMVMLQAWAMRAAQGWESSDVGEAGGIMADALQGAVVDLRSRISAFREVIGEDNTASTSRIDTSPNGRLEEVFENQGTAETTPVWIAFAAQAAARALDQRASTLESVIAVLRTSSVSMV